MECFPRLRLGWGNGWILLAALYAVFGLLLWIFPRDVVARLYDRSGWSRRLRMLSAMRALFSLPAFALMILTPLRLGSGVFGTGVTVFLVGVVGFTLALLNFRDTPPDQAATKGLYRLSRNPQSVALFLALYGICLTIGSWTALILVAGAQLFAHFRILAEEQSCLSQYGDAYEAYMRKVPRYFLFF